MHSLAKRLASWQNEHNEVRPRLCSAHFDQGEERVARSAEGVLRRVPVDEDAWVAELDSPEQGATLARMIDELVSKNKHVMVLLSPPGSGKSYTLLRVLQNWAAQSSQRQSLIDLLTPAADVPRPESVLQARRNSEARRRFLEEFGALTSGEIADLAGSTAANRSALANRWLKEGRLFAVTLHNTRYYPALQLDEHGRPLPVIARVLGALEAHELGEWEVALWFAKRTGWLGDRRPVDLLRDEPDAVVEVARRERHELVT
jgi:hypothetical protein